MGLSARDKFLDKSVWPLMVVELLTRVILCILLETQIAVFKKVVNRIQSRAFSTLARTFRKT